MKEKLLDLMKNEGLKPSQLAEMLGINPAGVSHILAGRNKPGFDLLQKILRRFPQISPDWLLLDNGPMYRTEPGTTSTSSGSPTGLSGLPGLPTSAGSAKDDGLFGLFPGATPESQGVASGSSSPSASSARTPEVAQPIRPVSDHGAVTRVVIFYDDQTFEYYTPTRR